MYFTKSNTCRREHRGSGFSLFRIVVINIIVDNFIQAEELGGIDLIYLIMFVFLEVAKYTDTGRHLL